MKSFGVILLLVLSRCVYAQQVPALLSIEGFGGNTYDQIYPWVVKCQDSGFIISITSQSTSGIINTSCVQNPNQGEDLFQKYSQDASQLIWEKCYSAAIDSAFMFLFPTTTGNFILAGFRNNPSDRNFLIRKEGANGNILWGSRHYGGSGGEILEDMLAASDGGYVMFGTTNSSDGDVGFHHGNVFNDDLWVLKVDSNGNKLWGTVLGGTADERAYALAAAPGNGVYVAGATYSTDGDCTDNHGAEDAFVARLDDSGHVLWHKCLGGSLSDGNETGWAVPDGKGGMLMATASYSTDGDVHNHIGNTDFWLFDIDSTGQLLWERSYGGSNFDYAKSVVRANDGSIWIAGETSSTDGQVYTSYGNGDAWIVHTDSAGNVLSSKVLGENQEDASDMLYALPGGMVLAGGIYYGAGPVGGEFPTQFYGTMDIFLARLTPWTTDVKEAIMGNDRVIAYPNPASDIIEIKSKNSGLYKATIKDIRGRIVYSADNVNNQTEIDVRNWPRGLYFVELVNGQGHNTVQKIIVE